MELAPPWDMGHKQPPSEPAPARPLGWGMWGGKALCAFPNLVPPFCTKQGLSAAHGCLLPASACPLAPRPAAGQEHRALLPGDLRIGFGQRKKHFGPRFWTPPTPGCLTAHGVTFCCANRGWTRTRWELGGQWAPTPKHSQTPQKLILKKKPKLPKPSYSV